MKISAVIGHKELATLNFWRAVLGEILISAIYIVIVCGAGLHILPEHKPSLLHICLTVGLTVSLLASGFWEISGGHFNPAVSLAFALKGTISVVRCIVYMIAQCVGSTAGSALLYVFTPEEFRGSLGVLQLHPKVSAVTGCAIEAILTYVLIWTILSSGDPIRGFTGYQASYAIGLSVTVGMLMGIPYTGASLNPMRSFGPAVVMNKMDHHWIYWVGPCGGAVIAVLAYDYVFKLKAPSNDENVNENQNDIKTITETSGSYQTTGSYKTDVFYIEKA